MIFVFFQSGTLSLNFYDIQWTSLSINEKKNLIMMMMGSLKPVQYTCGYIITLSLDSFTSVNIFLF